MASQPPGRDAARILLEQLRRLTLENLESQADELAQYFNLVWIPQSGNCGGESMGYDDLYWFNNYQSAFGSEQELRSMIGKLKQREQGPSPTW